MNLLNYASSLELAKYKTLNESLIQEADSDPSKAFDRVKSGMNGGSYKSQWDQLTSAIAKAVDAGKTSGTVMVKHDANVQGGADMVNIAWSVDGAGKVTLNVVSSQPKVNLANVSQTVKDASQKIWVALEGGLLDENEEAVYNVFRTDIKTDSDLQALLTYWNSLKIPFIQGGNTYYDQKSLENTAKKFANQPPNQYNYSLQFWLTGLFNNDEIKKVNDCISKYSTFRFKTA